MRARSGHIKFDKKVKYKNLAPVFKDIFLRFLQETKQISEENLETAEILLEENMRDLKKNRKPEGYNREANMRLIFPISDIVEFYLYSRGKSTEVARLTDMISRILDKEGLKHKVEWDKMLLFSERK